MKTENITKNNGVEKTAEELAELLVLIIEQTHLKNKENENKEKEIVQKDTSNGNCL